MGLVSLVVSPIDESTTACPGVDLSPVTLRERDSSRSLLRESRLSWWRVAIRLHAIRANKP